MTELLPLKVYLNIFMKWRKGIESLTCLCVCLFVCVFQNRVRPIALSFIVEFENNLA